MPQVIGFLLLPGFSLLEWAGARDAFAAANAIAEEAHYEERLFSFDGLPVPCQNQRPIPVDAALGDAGPLQALFVVAPGLPPLPAEPAACRALSAQAAVTSILGGIGSGAGWLAAAGLLEERRCTVRWGDVPELAQRHPTVVVSSQLYEIDAARPSCAGGSASLDMALFWLGQRHGAPMLRSLLAHFGLEQLRLAETRQGATRSAGASAGTPAKLGEAVTLMEANLSEPLATEDVAQLVGVSRRQLERLFKQHLDDLPARWYMQLRLARARRLLQESSQSILQIGLACGFASGPHFSRAYKAQFGHTPRDERAQRAAAWRFEGGQS